MSGAALGFGTASLLQGYGLGAGAVAVPGATLITHALAGGIRYIDTAAVYGDSERLLGQLAGELTAAGVRLATKVTAAQLLKDEFKQSLDRLGANRVDTLLLHSAAPGDLDDARCAAVLVELKDRGLIGRAGASTYGTAAAVAALAQPWCDTIQVEFSIVNPDVLAAVQRARRPSQEVVVRSVLCKGLLTERRRVSAAPVEAQQLLETLESRARQWRMTLPQLAVRFALDAAGVDVVLVGASTTNELDSAIQAVGAAPLSATQMSELATFNRSDQSWTHPEQWTQSH